MITLNELKKLVDNAIEKGYGENTVWVDTEARTYDAHLYPVKHFISEDIGLDQKYVVITLITNMSITFEEEKIHDRFKRS